VTTLPYQNVPIENMSDLLRIGVVGCGSFATSTIWPCLRYARIDIAYACATRLEHAERNRKRFGAEFATTDINDVLGDSSVAAIFLIGAPAMQYELGLRCLEAGKHLFVEKPPGESLEHSVQLERAAARTNVQCQVGFQKRFALAYTLARDHSFRADFGKVRLCKVNYSHWAQADWRSHLTDMSVHALDLVRFFMGDPVEGYIVKRSAHDGASTCVLTLLYEDGGTAVVNLSANDPHVQEWVELSGANQLISVRNLTEYRHWREASGPPQTVVMNERSLSMWQPAFPVPYQHSDSMWLQGYAGEVVEFAEATLEGRSLSPSISDGVAAMRYVEAIAGAGEGLSKIMANGDVIGPASF
jgi:UDP-N-acetylglucosamine 3-dehydrogenase